MPHIISDIRKQTANTATAAVNDDDNVMTMIMQYNNNEIGIAATLQLQMKKKNLTQQLDLRKNVHPRETAYSDYGNRFLGGVCALRSYIGGAFSQYKWIGREWGKRFGEWSCVAA